MGSVVVFPKLGSYVEEWIAVRFIAKEGIVPVKLLLKGTPWSIFEAMITDKASFIAIASGTLSWRVNDGDWVIKSPHGKVWYMDDNEFRSQFYAEDES